jgi:hypothetical protein
MMSLAVTVMGFQIHRATADMHVRVAWIVKTVGIAASAVTILAAVMCILLLAVLILYPDACDNILFAIPSWVVWTIQKDADSPPPRDGHLVNLFSWDTRDEPALSHADEVWLRLVLACSCIPFATIAIDIASGRRLNPAFVCRLAAYRGLLLWSVSSVDSPEFITAAFPVAWIADASATFAIMLGVEAGRGDSRDHPDSLVFPYNLTGGIRRDARACQVFRFMLSSACLHSTWPRLLGRGWTTGTIEDVSICFCALVITCVDAGLVWRGSPCRRAINRDQWYIQAQIYKEEAESAQQNKLKLK